MGVVTKAVRLIEDCLEHLREITGRGIDDLENFGRGGQLVERLVTLGKSLMELPLRLGKLALEIGNDLLRIGPRAVRR